MFLRKINIQFGLQMGVMLKIIEILTKQLVSCMKKILKQYFLVLQCKEYHYHFSVIEYDGWC